MDSVARNPASVACNSRGAYAGWPLYYSAYHAILHSSLSPSQPANAQLVALFTPQSAIVSTR